MLAPPRCNAGPGLLRPRVSAAVPGPARAERPTAAKGRAREARARCSSRPTGVPRSSSSPDASALQLPTPRGAAGRDWDLLRWPPARTATPCHDAKGAVPGRYSGSGGKC